MKKNNFFILLLSLCLVVFGGILLLFYSSLSETEKVGFEEESGSKTTAGPNLHENEAFPPIYVSIFTHNEEPNSGQYPNFVEDESAFWEQRNGVVQFAQMLHEEGVSYNFQSDWTFLLAATLYDSGTPSTQGKNVLRYLKEDLGFEIDPHAHETSYNYADVAYLIEQLGVEPSFVVGGFIADPPEKSKLEYLSKPIQRRQYSSYIWQAEILMGAGTSLHVNEEALWVSGIWKPQNNEQFQVHDDAASLVAVGSYTSEWNGLYELLELQKQGVLEPGKIYTASLFAKQKDFVNETYIEEFRQRIQDLADETAAGRIEWVGFGEVYSVWLMEYNAEPNQLFYTDVHSDEFASSGVETASDEGSCGDGICQSIEMRKGVCVEDCA